MQPGEKVPLDGTVIEGETFVDTAALTGESVPRKLSVGDEVLSGVINQNGAFGMVFGQAFQGQPQDSRTDIRRIELRGAGAVPLRR